jgi:hypothetical protein
MRDFLHAIVGVPNITSFTFNILWKVLMVLMTRIYAVIFYIHDRATTIAARCIDLRRSSG